MKRVYRLISLATIAAVAACGGGGGNPGSSTAGGTGQGPTVASFEVSLDKHALLNSGSDEAKLTVVALDQSRNPVPEANIKVASSSGIYTPDASTTDTGGRASGMVSIGGDKSNREINLTIEVGGKVKSESIAVTGSELNVSIPAVVAVGADVPFGVEVVDAKGAGIANVDVVFSGSLGYGNTIKTNASGKVDSTLKAPTTPGKYTLQVAASGVTTTREIQVGTTSGGGSISVPDAVGTISAATLSITPNTIAPNAVGSSAKRASLKAVFRDAQNRAIENVRARFEIVAPALGSGESISTGMDTVYSDSNGVANGEYVAATRTSPTNGVKIRVCYGMQDADIAAGACPNSRDATLTIAATALSVTLGDNNELEKGRNNLTYIKRFVVAVADAAGNPVPKASISRSVDLPFYLKGSSWNMVGKYRCENEDKNRNGFIDIADGDDLDKNGELSPRKADVVISGDTETDANGLAVIKVEYAQSVATWLAYDVKVTTSVEGSEGTVQKSYITGFVEGDEKNGSFLTPAYGQNACNVPN